MKFQAKDTLTEQEIQSGLKIVIKDGLASQTMVTLTGGVFLVAFALKLGASNTIIGLLAAIPALAQLVQIPAIYFIEKYRTRKIISLYASGSSRVLWLIIALIPFFFNTGVGIVILILALLLLSAFGAVSSCSWNSWMRDLVPQDQLGSFFSRRMKLTMILATILSLAAAFYLDKWKNIFPEYELQGYSILFMLGLLAGMIGLYFISRIPEPKMSPAAEKTQIFKLILQPFKDGNFRQLIIFLGSWHFAVNLAAPFFIVYMLRRLDLGMSLIIALTVMSQIMYVIFIQIWGRFSDHYSNKSVLRVSGPLFMICILAWTFTTFPGKHFLTIPLLVAIHILMGISTAGVTLATGNIGLKLAPRGTATAYLAASGFINSLAAGIAPLLGGVFADFFAERELSLILKWISPGMELLVQTLNFQQWDFFFFIAFLIGLYSIHRLSLVKEIGEVEEKIVINELVSEVRRISRNLTTVGGLRDMILFPFAIIKKVPGVENKKKTKTNKVTKNE